VIQTKPLLCLDTSAFNALLDDEENERLISLTNDRFKPLITSIAIAEVIATPGEDRRWALLSLMKRMSDGTRPLAMPNTLLWRATREFGKANTKITVTITERDAAFWHILENPQTAGDSERLKALEWKDSLERSFSEAHARARGAFQNLFSQDPTSRPRNVAALFRYFRTHDQEIYSFVAKSYRRETGKTLARGALWQLFKRVPNWPIYLAGWGHEMFARAISETNYGRRGKPGNLDLWCAGYLPYCDVFVTNDEGEGRGGQYNALRLLNRLISPDVKPQRARILTFRRFRTTVLSGA